MLCTCSIDLETTLIIQTSDKNKSVVSFFIFFQNVPQLINRFCEQKKNRILVFAHFLHQKANCFEVIPVPSRSYFAFKKAQSKNFKQVQVEGDFFFPFSFLCWFIKSTLSDSLYVYTTQHCTGS